MDELIKENEELKHTIIELEEKLKNIQMEIITNDIMKKTKTKLKNKEQLI